RTVALKIIKLGMDTRQVIERFGMERQVLASLEHPNIARVYDAGVTTTGRPYFVMELVANGKPITAFCHEHRLSIQDRLKLFVSICGALQHAHKKGITHRDIKPSNVLVTLLDGRPEPKVIDFGIAKAVNADPAELARLTAPGQLMGTPAYMSPEQARGSGWEVNKCSDIYSIGVVLFEVLTGTPLLDPQQRRSAN